MDFLFDSRGKHIANRVGGQLHAPRGSNIGHWMENDAIFIDMRGRYLGEIVQGDRLMYCKNSPSPQHELRQLRKLRECRQLWQSWQLGQRRLRVGIRRHRHSLALRLRDTLWFAARVRVRSPNLIRLAPSALAGWARRRRRSSRSSAD